jgi:hypothetical protein
MDITSIAAPTPEKIRIGDRDVTLRHLTNRDVAALKGRFPTLFDELAQGVSSDLANAMLAMSDHRPGDAEAEAFFDQLPSGLHTKIAQKVIEKTWGPFDVAGAEPAPAPPPSSSGSATSSEAPAAESQIPGGT